MGRAPIAGERNKFRNDDAWLNAIRKFSRPREEMRWRGDGLTGGAMELSRELKGRAKEAPERFLSLLARFPEGTYQDFAWGITAGIAETKPDTDMIERVLAIVRSEEHTSELQSLMRLSYAVFCLKKKKKAPDK